MRAVSVFAGIAFATVAGAEPSVEVQPCGDQPSCVFRYRIADFGPIWAQPVLIGTGDMLRLAGAQSGAGAVLLDLSLATGALGKVIPLAGAKDDLTAVEIAPGGSPIAVFAPDGIGFFDGAGARLGHLGLPAADGWPSGVEVSPVDLFRRFAGMNMLRFDVEGLRIDYAGFAFSVAPGSGVLTWTPPDVAGQDGTDLTALFDRLVDPVGYETYWFGAAGAAATNAAVDGRPAQLALLDGGQSEIPYAMPAQAGRGDVTLDANEDGDYARAYAGLALTVDGSRLAALRHEGTRDGRQVLVVFDTATGDRIAALDVTLADPWSARTVWLSDGRLVLVGDVTGEGDPASELLLLRPPGPP